MPDPSVHTCRTTLRVGQPFELKLALFGHGWIGLAPHDWSEDTRTWRTAALLDDGTPVDLAIRPAAAGLSIGASAARPLASADRAQLRAVVRHCLNLDAELGAFHDRCRDEPGLRWVARRGAGRLLRSPSMFEDLLKLLFTTNCSWPATELMVKRTVEALGAPTPSGRRCFPTAGVCARRPESFWRNTVRAGYRAGHCRALARAFASGELCDKRLLDPHLAADDAFALLLALPGFGPYAAGQALRLCGHFGELAIDSWCRAKLTELLGRRTPPTDKSIARRYARFGEHRGLALWMELTADWHGEGA